MADMKTLAPEEVLALPMLGSKNETQTVRQYLVHVFALLWTTGDMGGVLDEYGKDWNEPLFVALVRHGLVEGESYLRTNEDGTQRLNWLWYSFMGESDAIVNSALRALAGV